MLLNSFVIWMFICFMITIMLYMVSILFFNKEMSINSNEPFECGKELMSDSHVPFCFHFFMVGILFLVFDMELVLLVPMLYMNSNINYWMMVWLFILFLLIIGLVLEVMLGSLDLKE
uniref:NADH dehydrogenase subunit 3 n=1 Tax=Docophoroides brevis TaxID=160119 RepID=UPI00211E0FCD|nr:NADH dehydrogenase subunit 3 [Docophoroides brevis]UTT72589.1 NADH dehydrogenase subunit 3 [Docophoroides brevis]